MAGWEWFVAAIVLWVFAVVGILLFIYGATKGRDDVPAPGDRQQPPDER